MKNAVERQTYLLNGTVHPGAKKESSQMKRGRGGYFGNI
jgi:hypothetical protein